VRLTVGAMNTPVGQQSRTAGRLQGFSEDEFRRTLGHFCTGVAVITALDGEPVGFTCQSFTSLSLDPPLVSVSVANRSRSLPRIRRSGAFSANILSAGQEHLARRFAAATGNRFADVAWEPAPVTGTPQLAGAMACVEALVEDAIAGGDHTILIGRVVGLRTHGGVPLIYFGGGFHDRGIAPH
jgi:3-hydroxy-9,10-secoandrosta-1,3,5(10)-triene-9,17-dione monooxygenase reductase component